MEQKIKQVIIIKKEDGKISLALTGVKPIDAIDLMEESVGQLIRMIENEKDKL